MEGSLIMWTVTKIRADYEDGGYSVTGQKTLLKNINIKILMTCLSTINN